jgi:pimeloyl-ACP methyl ester carboxylesterase
MREGTIALKDGRHVGFADFGTPDQTAVLWCHGGPGCRIEPDLLDGSAREAGLRFVGIDRPGYGWSTPQPGRTIGGWITDALAVLDHLGIDRFVTVGASTGGAYALALASSSDRVIAAVACCAVTDMGWSGGKALIPSALPVWKARSRDEAMAIVAEQMGEDGGKVSIHTGGFPLPDSDKAVFADPVKLAWWLRCMKEMFAQGVAGYTDDRLADGRGWDTFDVAKITCPVAVIHGGSDSLALVANARHTASIVPGATLRIYERHGHISVFEEIVGAVVELLAQSGHIGSRAAAGSA